MADRIQTVRDCYAAYESGDPSALEAAFSDDFMFYAPPDPGIDLATYWERCWPNAGLIESYEFKRLEEIVDDEVLVTYESPRPMAAASATPRSTDSTATGSAASRSTSAGTCSRRTPRSTRGGWDVFTRSAGLQEEHVHTSLPQPLRARLGAQPFGDLLADQRALVLLEEVGGVGDDVVDAGVVDGGGEPLADVERQHGVLVGPEEEHRALVGRQRLQHGAALGRPRAVLLVGNQEREGAGAGLLATDGNGVS